jgi:hypothetical protein
MNPVTEQLNEGGTMKVKANVKAGGVMMSD